MQLHCNAELLRIQGGIMAAIGKIASAYPTVTHGEVEWSGSGDEGDVDLVSWYSADNLVVPVPGDDFGDLVSDLLQSLFGSWYDSEGGRGAARVDVKNRAITIKHYWYEELLSPNDVYVVTDEGIESSPPKHEFDDPEVEAVLAALTYYAPAYQNATEPFAIAHQRACELLARRSTLSPDDIRDAVEGWR